MFFLITLYSRNYAQKSINQLFRFIFLLQILLEHDKDEKQTLKPEKMNFLLSSCFLISWAKICYANKMFALCIINLIVKAEN